MLHQIITDRSAWVGRDFADKSDFTYKLDNRALDALNSLALRHGDAIDEPWLLPRAALRHPYLREALAPIQGELRHGRGFAVVSGLPLAGRDLAATKLLYWIFGAQFGFGQSQSNLGDRIGEVTDVTHVDPHARGYRSNRDLKHHTDICDMIALLAVRGAQSGGASSVASAVQIHNRFRRERPDLLARLYEGYYYHRRGEEAPGDDPVTPHKIPVYSVAEGRLNFRFVRPYMEYALKVHGHSDPQLVEAFDLIERFAAEDQVSFTLAPGEVLLLNNLSVLHARTGFVDWPEPERKRLLLRLWLNEAGFRPQSLTLNLHGDGSGIPFVPGRTSSFAGFA